MMQQNDWQAYFPSSDDLLEVFAAGEERLGRRQDRLDTAG